MVTPHLSGTIRGWGISEKSNIEVFKSDPLRNWTLVLNIFDGRFSPVPCVLTAFWNKSAMEIGSRLRCWLKSVIMKTNYGGILNLPSRLPECVGVCPCLQWAGGCDPVTPLCHCLDKSLRMLCKLWSVAPCLALAVGVSTPREPGLLRLAFVIPACL